MLPHTGKQHYITTIRLAVVVGEGGPAERSNPTQHAKGRTGDCPGPRKGTTTRRNVTQGVLRDGRDRLLGSNRSVVRSLVPVRVLDRGRTPTFAS